MSDPRPLADGLSPADELEHPGSAVEAWWFWAWAEDLTVGLFVGLEVRGRRFDYWCGLARAGEPYLYVEELDGEGRRDGLELKPPEMWADHRCDDPFGQWSVGNEAYGVAFDDPDEVFGRAYGLRTPVAMDIEWYAEAPPEPIAGGYVQRGSADVVVELASGHLRLDGPAHRAHVWGGPFRPATTPTAADPVAGLRAPYRLHDGQGIDQVLTVDGVVRRNRADGV